MATKAKQDRRGCPKGGGVVESPTGAMIGNPKHTKDPQIAQKVKLCRSLGMGSDEIGQIIGHGKDTVLRHYRDEFECGLVEANMKMGAAIFNSGLGERVQCVTCGGAKVWKEGRMCPDCKGAGHVWIREPNPTAQVWWSKNRMCWTDRAQVEVGGIGGGPILTEQVSSGSVVKDRLRLIKEKLDGK